MNGCKNSVLPSFLPPLVHLEFFTDWNPEVTFGANFKAMIKIDCSLHGDDTFCTLTKHVGQELLLQAPRDQIFRECILGHPTKPSFKGLGVDIHTNTACREAI